MNGSGLPRCFPYSYTSRQLETYFDTNTRTHARDFMATNIFHEKEPHIRCFLIPIREGTLSGGLPQYTQPVPNRQTVSWPYKRRLPGLTERLTDFSCKPLPWKGLNVFIGWRQGAGEEGGNKWILLTSTQAKEGGGGLHQIRCPIRNLAETLSENFIVLVPIVHW